jgi:opacity protein-like surface antigen
MPRISVALLLSAFCLAPAVAHAQYDFPGARALGQGEAIRATATGAEAVMLNPAGMSLVKQYVIEGMYGFNVENLGHHVHLSVVDSITSRVAAGLFYDFIYTEPKLGFNWAGGQIQSERWKREGHAAGLSLSMALGDKFMIGLTTKYLHFDTNAPLPKGTSPGSLDFDHVNGVTFDVGLIVRLGDKFNIAAIGYNLWDHGREAPISLGFGLAYVPLPVLSINFDTSINFTGYKTLHVDSTDPSKIKLENKVSARLGPGIEWKISGKVPVRVGYLYDSGLSGQYLTMGVGYLSPQFGIDLGYRVKVGGGLENFLMLGLRLFIN